MFTLSHTTIINIHKEPVDMRLGVYSLQGLIAGSGCSVREGAHYAFTNRPRTLLRTVWFDGTGLCMFSKRLERGTFSWPREASPGESVWEGIQPSAFGLLLEGIELRQGMRKAWYER